MPTVTVPCGTCGGCGFVPSPGCTCRGPHDASAGCLPVPCPNPVCVAGQVPR
jgi:hypothetical protein